MDLFGAATDLLGGVGSYLSGSAASSGSKDAAAAYAKAAQYATLETGIKEQMASRSIYQTIGLAKAQVGASGLKESGSAEDVMRSSAQQGALTKALIETQGNAEVASYTGMSQAASAAAKSQSSGGILGAIGGIIGAIGSIFSDDRLKTDIELIERRPDGIGIYRFRFKGDGPFFDGVLASEVEKVYPEAVTLDDFGFKMVDYDAIGAPWRLSGSAS